MNFNLVRRALEDVDPTVAGLAEKPGRHRLEALDRKGEG